MAYQEAKGSGHRGKQLDHLRVMKAERGGHIVEHHFVATGMNQPKPEVHPFAKDEDHEMLAHIAHHMDADMPGEPESPEEEGEQPAEGEYYSESKARKG